MYTFGVLLHVYRMYYAFGTYITLLRTIQIYVAYCIVNNIYNLYYYYFFIFYTVCNNSMCIIHMC